MLFQNKELKQLIILFSLFKIIFNTWIYKKKSGTKNCLAWGFRGLKPLWQKLFNSLFSQCLTILNHFKRINSIIFSKSWEKEKINYNLKIEAGQLDSPVLRVPMFSSYEELKQKFTPRILLRYSSLFFFYSSYMIFKSTT